MANKKREGNKNSLTKYNIRHTMQYPGNTYPATVKYNGIIWPKFTSQPYLL